MLLPSRRRIFQRVKKSFLLTGIHLYLGTEQKRMDEDKSMQWGTWDRELCNLVLYSVRGNVICYKNNCKPRHVTIVGSQVWAVSEERQRNVGSELSDLVTLHIPRQILVNREGAGDHTGHCTGPLAATRNAQQSGWVMWCPLTVW